jgi:hypothetical protein
LRRNHPSSLAGRRGSCRLQRGRIDSRLQTSNERQPGSVCRIKPMTSSHDLGCMLNGTNTAMRSPTTSPSKPAGATPTTVNGSHSDGYLRQ